MTATRRDPWDVPRSYRLRQSWQYLTRGYPRTCLTFLWMAVIGE